MSVKGEYLEDNNFKKPKIYCCVFFVTLLWHYSLNTTHIRRYTLATSSVFFMPFFAIDNFSTKYEYCLYHYKTVLLSRSSFVSYHACNLFSLFMVYEFVFFFSLSFFKWRNGYATPEPSCVDSVYILSQICALFAIDAMLVAIFATDMENYKYAIFLPSLMNLT